ncbi:MAG: phage major capsid protein [Oceanibulbus sp.]|nr:phage major capsid protein [Sulfitobacter sp.]
MKKYLMPAASLAAMAAAMPAAIIGAPRMDAAGSVEQLLGEVRNEVTRLSNEIKPIADKALNQATKTGDMTAEVKAAADKALNQLVELSKAQSKLEGTLEAIEARTAEVEQGLAAGHGGPTPAQSLGQEIAGMDELKSWVQNGLSGNLTVRPQAAITTASADGLIAPTRDGVVNMARRRLTIRALLNVATTESDRIVFARQITRTDGVAPVAEGAAAPVSDFAWEEAEATVKKIATVTHASDEALADAGQLAGMIDGELRYLVDLEEEAQILTGDGLGQNLSGLVTNATAFSAAAGLPNDTRIDRIRLALLQVSLADYIANGIALHPTDWAAIELLKDTTNRYVFGDPGQATAPRLWGLDVVATPSLSANEWLVGDFSLAATLYDRQQTEVLISSEHSDNFVKGMKTIKAVKRLALADKRPAAMVTGDFTFV